MPVPFKFDYKNPDYVEVFQWRFEKLQRMRNNPSHLPALFKFYKDHPEQFIIDWGITYDPRNVERGLPAMCPFILFPRQEEWVIWTRERWLNQEGGLSDKSRDVGVSWLATSLASTMCLFNDMMQVGFGSRKQEYVDKLGDPKSLLYKCRKFVEHVPREFRGAWNVNKHAPHMRIVFPTTGSIISGESGDGIGRGDRASIYFVDEAAWLPRPQLVDASLSETTNCRIDISTPRGMGNSFAKKRFGGKVKVFSLHWRDDPRKDDAWYRKKCEYLDDPVIVAQELDLDYTASIEGIVIPAQWIEAAVDAHIKLGFSCKGIRKLSLDPADEGDKIGVVGRHGVLIDYVAQKSGEGSDLFKTTEWVITLADVMDYISVDYDADGLGAAIRGDARVINDVRMRNDQRKIHFNPFHGSGAVTYPTEDPFRKQNELKDSDKGRTNEDYFANFKAQSWWAVRQRFKLTYRAVTEGGPFDPDELISISSQVDNLQKLKTELSQPVFFQNDAGKIVIDKKPNGMKSPNLADSVIIVFAPYKKPAKGFFSD
jgi:phage terminase large subunit